MIMDNSRNRLTKFIISTDFVKNRPSLPLFVNYYGKLSGNIRQRKTLFFLNLISAFGSPVFRGQIFLEIQNAALRFQKNKKLPGRGFMLDTKPFSRVNSHLLLFPPRSHNKADSQADQRHSFAQSSNSLTQWRIG